MAAYVVNRVYRLLFILFLWECFLCGFILVFTLWQSSRFSIKFVMVYY